MILRNIGMLKLFRAINFYKFTLKKKKELRMGYELSSNIITDNITYTTAIGFYPSLYFY